MDLDADDPCPCESGKRAGACCVRRVQTDRDDGSTVVERRLELAQADPRPARPRTGVSVKGCYAASFADCGGVISDEHFISHGMLKRLAGADRKPLTVSGIDPKNPKLTRPVSPRNMIAPVLCERHNRALKPIDTAGNRFFNALASLGKWLNDEPAETKRTVAVNGHDLERWCLKALCGFLARASKPVPEPWVRMLFGYDSSAILLPRGLYMYGQIGDVLEGGIIRVEEIIYRDEGAIGVIVKLLNQELVFSMSTNMPIALTDRHDGKFRVCRPGAFIFTNRANGSRFGLYLCWQDSLPHESFESNWSAPPTTT